MELSPDFKVNVYTADPGRGHSPEQLAEMCVNSIIHVSASTHPAIRDQAEAFREKMRGVVEEYLRKAVKSDRVTVYNAICDAGMPDLAKFVKEI